MARKAPKVNLSLLAEGILFEDGFPPVTEAQTAKVKRHLAEIQELKRVSTLLAEAETEELEFDTPEDLIAYITRSVH